MAHVKLLPCPFCGTEAAQKDGPRIERNDRLSYKGEPLTWYYATCGYCCAQTYIFEDKESAIDSWNMRAPSLVRS